MNTGQGYFEEVSEEKIRALEKEDTLKSRIGKALKDRHRIFEVGEELEIRGSRFRVRSIGSKELHLTLLPDFPNG